MINIKGFLSVLRKCCIVLSNKDQHPRAIFKLLNDLNTGGNFKSIIGTSLFIMAEIIKYSKAPVNSSLSISARRPQLLVMVWNSVVNINAKRSPFNLGKPEDIVSLKQKWWWYFKDSNSSKFYSDYVLYICSTNLAFLVYYPIKITKLLVPSVFLVPYHMKLLARHQKFIYIST